MEYFLYRQPAGRIDADNRLDQASLLLTCILRKTQLPSTNLTLKLVLLLRAERQSASQNHIQDYSQRPAIGRLGAIGFISKDLRSSVAGVSNKLPSCNFLLVFAPYHAIKIDYGYFGPLLLLYEDVFQLQITMRVARAVEMVYPLAYLSENLLSQSPV